MLFDNPVPTGKLRPHKLNYPKHPLAAGRPNGTRLPRVTHDFGPSGIALEPAMNWPGGESDIFGRKIPRGHYEDFHQGLDISTGGCGDEVVAAAPGTVLSAGANKAEAIVVVVTHGKVNGHVWHTRYAHLQAEGLIKKNTPVVAGTVLGRIGTTGKLSTGCHLHFAVTRDDVPVDPWRRLRQNTTVDPDAPKPPPAPAPAPAPAPNPPPAPAPNPPPLDPPPLMTPVQEVDVPRPISDQDYLAGHVAIVTNPGAVVQVERSPRTSVDPIRTIAIGSEEVWLPTCWVQGESIASSEKWLTRWFGEQWEFTHFSNVPTVTIFESATEDDGDVGIDVSPGADFEVDHQATDPV